jgi:S1-C subfamily serine protease
MRRRLGPVVAFAVAASLVATSCVPPPVETAAGAVEAPSGEALARDSVVRIRSVGSCGVAIGSGFVIDGRRLVTNRHVVAGARRLDVETWDGEPVRIGDARQALETDLAVIDLPARSARQFEPLELAEDPAGVGGSLTAIGYAEAGPAVITRGQLVDRPSGRHHLNEPGDVLRMSTGLRHGNSGGPVLTDDQQVAGVAYAYDPDTLLTLAIPMERLRRVLDDPAAWEPVQPC